MQTLDEEISRSRNQADAFIQSNADSATVVGKKRCSRTTNHAMVSAEDKLIVAIGAGCKRADRSSTRSDREHHDGNTDEAGKKRSDQNARDRLQKRHAEVTSPRPTGQGVAFDGKLFFDAGMIADFRYKTTSSQYGLPRSLHHRRLGLSGSRAKRFHRHAKSATVRRKKKTTCRAPMATAVFS